jgi:hypothetical protein
MAPLAEGAVIPTTLRASLDGQGGRGISRSGGTTAAGLGAAEVSSLCQVTDISAARRAVAICLREGGRRGAEQLWSGARWCTGKLSTCPLAALRAKACGPRRGEVPGLPARLVPLVRAGAHFENGQLVERTENRAA